MTADLMVNAFRQMAADDLQGGTVLYGGQSYPATVGVFEFVPVFGSGGISPSLSAMVEVADEDLPDTVVFQKGQPITVRPTTGAARECRIDSFTQQGPLWALEVMDLNQNA